MTVRVYRDDDSLSVFFQEGVVGAWPFNCLQAIGNGDNTISIRNVAKEYANGDDFFEIVDVNYAEFEDQSGTAYGANETDAVNALNAAFTANGSPTVAPVITSATSIALTTGDTLNYELTADGGVGYEWASLPAGVTTVEGNVRKLIGGSGLTAGSYPFTATAINYFGTDTETITLTVSNPAFNDTKSINFVNQDYLQATASLLSGVLGRTGNGSGSGDAWSISLWFKGGTSNNSNQTIFYFGDSDLNNGGRIQLTYRGSSNETLRFQYGSNNNYLRFETQANTLTSGTWHHVLLTYDGGTTGSSSGDINDYYSRFAVYIDGVLMSTTKSNANFGWSAAVDSDLLRVGRLSGNYMRNDCRVDELAVWDSDQSANVANIYNSGTPSDLSLLGTPPDHWWRMGDGDTFPTLQDSVGTADFTMNNMTAADIVTDTP